MLNLFQMGCVMKAGKLCARRTLLKTFLVMGKEKSFPF